MKCPSCGYIDSKVIDSRPADEGSSIRRRRECLMCLHRFTTYEYIETVPLMVIKKGNGRQPFDRNKILNGIIKACEKRPVTAEQMQKMAEEIESGIRALGESECSSAEIGVRVMEKLKEIDEVAYVRFASVYREFKDVNTFMDELKRLINNAN